MPSFKGINNWNGLPREFIESYIFSETKTNKQKLKIPTNADLPCVLFLHYFLFSYSLIEKLHYKPPSSSN